MPEPLIDLTLPVEHKPRQSGPAKRKSTSPRGTVQRQRASSVAKTAEQIREERVAENAAKYQAWLSEHADAVYIRGLSFIAGADITHVGIPQPDGTTKALSAQVSWKEGPKPYLAGHALAELEELPQIQKVIAWFGPLAPWLMVGSLGVAIGVDVVAMMRLRPVLRSQQAQEIQPEPQPQEAAQPQAA